MRVYTTVICSGGEVPIKVCIVKVISGQVLYPFYLAAWDITDGSELRLVYQETFHLMSHPHGWITLTLHSDGVLQLTHHRAHDFQWSTAEDVNNDIGHGAE